MIMNGLNSEQEALLDQFEFEDDILPIEAIKMLQEVNLEDVDLFYKGFSGGILQSTIETLKNMV